MTSNDIVVLIDAHGLAYRNFYGIPILTDDSGEPINAVYGIARFLLWLDINYPHEYGAVVFDKGRPEKRLELLPEYKAQRPLMPEDLRSQLPKVREWVAGAGWPILEEEGKEADDLIAGIVAERDRKKVYIVSHDKDLGQLLEDSVIQLIPDTRGGKNKWREISPSALQEKLGVSPGMVPDYLAMVGDSSDNIPGVPGIGPKRAAALLQQFGSIDAMLEQSEEIEKPAWREKIENSRELLKKNRQLVTLDASPPVDWKGIAGIRRSEPDWEKMRQYALRYNFKSLLKSIDKGLDESRNPRLL